MRAHGELAAACRSRGRWVGAPELGFACRIPRVLPSSLVRQTAGRVSWRGTAQRQHFGNGQQQVATVTPAFSTSETWSDMPPAANPDPKTPALTLTCARLLTVVNDAGMLI